MTSPLPFVKATAYGNDFILIDGGLVRTSDLKDVTKRICDRHLGVGADGVEWLFPATGADIEARLINSDGSDAEVSGNGTRCVAAWSAYKQQLSEGHSASDNLDDLKTVGASHANTHMVVRVLTGAGLKTCTLLSRKNMDFEFNSEMGEPKVDGEIALILTEGECKGIRLSMGNPQFVVFKKEFSADWQKEASEIEGHSAFPQRTNVEFVKVVGPQEIEIRIFERGAGETQSSGTGSCASAIAAIHTGRVKSPVKVISPGGAQIVTWDGSVLLQGSARILCQGEFFL